MTIDSISGTTQQTPTAAKSAMSDLSNDFDSFLKLLTAQVANQDPLKPMDSTTFVTQLAQLSQVEQSVKANTNLEQIAAKLSAAADLSGIQLIGRDVTLTTDRIETSAGSGDYTYELQGTAQNVRAEILSADGSVLRTISGLPTNAEVRHRLTQQFGQVVDAVFLVVVLEGGIVPGHAPDQLVRINPRHALHREIGRAHV